MKLPARYVKLTQEEMSGDSKAAGLLMKAGQAAMKGGRPVPVDPRKDILRPGIIQWKDGEVGFNMKAGSAGSGMNEDLSKSLAARYETGTGKQGERVAEFDTVSKAAVAVEKAGEAKQAADQAAVKAVEAGKAAVEAAKVNGDAAKVLAGYYFGQTDAAGVPDEVKAKGMPGMPRKRPMLLMHCAVALVIGVAIGYFLSKRS